MKELTGGATFFGKRVFPALWFGFLGLAAVQHAMQVANGSARWSWTAVAAIGALTLVGLGVMSAVVFDLADHVYDGGDHLLVQKGKRTARIPFSDIAGVSESYLLNPPRITLRLHRAGVFGHQVVFSPRLPMPWSPFSNGPIAKDLIERVRAARAPSVPEQDGRAGTR